MLKKISDMHINEKTHAAILRKCEREEINQIVRSQKQPADEVQNKR